MKDRTPFSYNKVFAVASGSTAVSAKAKKGTTIRYTLSEAAKARFTIERKLSGRRSGKKCVKPSKKLSKKKLAPGNYRITLRATDAAGNVSKPRATTFRIVKK